MRKNVVYLLAALAACFTTAMAQPLTVVEMFASQTCPHSPKGIDVLADYAGRDDLLALTFPVTYWNYLGWEDTLGEATFDARQKRYVKNLPGQWLYTPQAVVQGRTGVKGDDMAAIDEAIAGQGSDNAASLTITDNGASYVIKAVGDVPASAVPVFLFFEPGPVSVDVGGGRNAGKTLIYRNVVRELVEGAYEVPKSSRAGLSCAALLQDPVSGVITAAAKCPR